MPRPFDQPPPSGPYADYLGALGVDWFADDPVVGGLIEGVGRVERAKVAALGRMAATSAAPAASRGDRFVLRARARDDHGRPHPVGVEVSPDVRRVLAAALTAGAALEPDPQVRRAMLYLLAQAGDGGWVLPLITTAAALPHLPESAAQHVRTQAPGGPVHVAIDAGARTHGTYEAWNGWARYRLLRTADGWCCWSRLQGDEPHGFRVDGVRPTLGLRATGRVELSLLAPATESLGDLGSSLASALADGCSAAFAGFLRGAARHLEALGLQDPTADLRAAARDWLLDGAGPEVAPLLRRALQALGPDGLDEGRTPLPRLLRDAITLPMAASLH